tara:strand:+ start:10 stop:321 length:312 start_codon:yes stop_codon:yes gene_type:complete
MKINPNPKPHTNSEMDSKTIIKQPKLNESQIYDLITQYVEIRVDRMSHSDLVEHVTQDLIDWYSDFSLEELKDTISVNDEDLYDELVDNVTQQYPKQLNSFGG